MHQHRKVPGIAPNRPQIGVEPSRPVQSPLMIGQHQPPQTQAPAATISEATQDLAMEIYARLAVDHIRQSQSPDPSTLQTLARQSQSAALTYFQTLGVQFDG